MRMFQAAFRLYRPRYFKWTKNLGQEGREECTFDDINFIIEGDSLDADSKGKGKGKGNNIFDRPIDNVKGKDTGKGKGHYGAQWR